MSDNTRHAQILADIARQVVESYRNAQPIAEPTTEDTPTVDPSWNYQLPERYQG